MKIPSTLFVLVSLISTVVSASGAAYFVDHGDLKEISSTQYGSFVKKLSVGAKFTRLFDLKRNGSGPVFLLSKSPQHTADVGKSSKGDDLWLLDVEGRERWVSNEVFRAKLSQDSKLIGYTTSECELNVETASGTKVTTVEGAYDPSWNSDGTAIVLSKANDGDQDLQHPNALRICVLNLNSKKLTSLTNGHYDDARPEFSPAGNWILFVSGARSGLASFWKVSGEGGDPTQLTNLSMTRVTDKFVPTPYLRTTWSKDGRWFLYDYKKGGAEETWGLEFTDDGRLLRALKLAQGLFPQFWEDGKHFTVIRQVSGEAMLVSEVLP